MAQVSASPMTPAHQELARWLMRRERDAGAQQGPRAPIDLAEQVVRKLSPRVAVLVTETGYRALLSRALHLAKTEYPFLDSVEVGTADAYIDGSRVAAGRVIDDGLAGLIATLIALLARFIGDDLTDNLIRDAWPDAPSQRLARGAGGTR